MKTHFFLPKTYFLPDFGFEGVACSTLPPCKHENERKKFWGKNVNTILKTMNVTKGGRKRPFSLKLSSEETKTFAKRVIADY